MSRSLIRLSFLPVLAAALFVSGCERAELPGAPSVPEFSARGAAALHRVPGRVPAEVATTAVQVISAAGGSVELAGHRLVVPAGAVARPTRFSLKLVESGFVEVDLHAVQSSGVGADLDVGKRGFATPVTLQLSYELAAELDNPGAVVIAWVKPEGTLQPLRSSHDRERRTITAELDHFSRYVLATP